MQYDTEFPTITTTRLKLVQVFQNLVANAIKHNDKEKVEIHIGAMPSEKEGYVQFYVQDNGPGVAQRDTDRIFRLFERGDSATGTGIGLNIFKMLVEEQGGKVWVESNPGIGSKFFFEWSKQ